MSKVTTGATMSLDGFIADANHGVTNLGYRVVRK
jgi:hypothetical protein